AYRPSQWVPQVQRRLLEATAAQEARAQAHNATVDAAVAALRKQLNTLQAEYADKLFAARLAALPAAIRADTRRALATAPAKRTEVQRYLASKFEAELRPKGPALAGALAQAYPEYAARAAALAQAVGAQQGTRRTFPEIRALYDLPGE